MKSNGIGQYEFEIKRHFCVYEYFQVTQNDKMTSKLCENCLTKVNYIVRFREMCAATDMQMKMLMGHPIGTDVSKSLNLQSARESTTIRNGLNEEISVKPEIVTSRKRRRQDRGSYGSEP